MKRISQLARAEFSTSGAQEKERVPTEDERKERIEHERWAYLCRIVHKLDFIVQRVLDGDEQCGLFLGELIPFLARREKELMAANEHFNRRLLEIRHSQKARKQGRTLRRVIEEILHEAQSQRRLGHRVHVNPRLISEPDKAIKAMERSKKRLARARKRKRAIQPRFRPGSDEPIWPTPSDVVEIEIAIDDLRARVTQLKAAASKKALLALPEFGPSSCEQWFDVTVYPELKRREPDLRNNPLIGNLKKATKSGKFQLSDLKELACDTVRRIASLPRAYFFWK